MNDDLFRQRAKRRLLILVAALAAIAIGAWYFSHLSTHTEVASLESKIGSAVAKEVQKSVSDPVPFIATGTNVAVNTDSQNADTLTRAGIISQTNAQRNENGGLAALSENTVLDKVASERLDDMISKQYFAHVSPSSSSAETVAQADGYDYIALGENLALGNFAGDQGVVAAWMGSPGHRTNILNTHYTEIGVAAAKTIFDGSEAWLAVQVFGRPASDCPAPSAAAKSSLDAAEAELANMENELKSQLVVIDSMSPSGATYDADVAAYNDLAAQYNALLGTTQANINAYDGAVETYNACLGN
jgi:uncharacterized protein YkwD